MNASTQQDQPATQYTDEDARNFIDCWCPIYVRAYIDRMAAGDAANAADMRPDLFERIETAIGRLTRGDGIRHVPADGTDPDLVLAECRDQLVALQRQVAAAIPRASVERYCRNCGSPRPGESCWKCGGETIIPSEKWKTPRLPDITPIREAAKECGYALGVHGSQQRDLDVIAVAWSDKAIDREQMLHTVAERINARVLVIEPKPLGRIAATLQIDGYFRPIDISVAPFAPRADEGMARHWIDRYAAGIDDEPQMDLIAEALGVVLPAPPAPSTEGKA
jgi:hypothetical protein